MQFTRSDRALSSLAPAVRPHEAAHKKIREHGGHKNADQKTGMSIMICGRLMPVLAQLPRPPGAKEGKKSKKHSSQLQPQNPREFDERRPDSLSKAPAAANQSLSGLPSLHR
jgi:hypothetical protein